MARGRWRYRDLGDPTLMANAWDEPATVDAQPATYPPRRFGQLQNLSVPDTFDDPITDAEIAAWEGDSPSYAAGGMSGQP